jgi:hypothetical protein
VLAGVDQDCVPECAEALKGRIVQLAALLATARTYVERGRDHTVERLPEPEGPSRIALQLFKLGQGLALINRRNEVTAADLPVLTRVALDSMPLIRRKVLGVLVECSRKKRRPFTGAFVEALGLSQSAVHERLEDLCLLKVCDKRPEPGNKVSYGLTREFGRLIAGVGFGTPGTGNTAR